MGFFLHLRLIMWKNFTIRRRRKVRCLIDVLWPLVLFVMLVALRIVGFKESIQECHYEPRALPSAGMGAFLRGLLCTINNTCHATEAEASPELRAELRVGKRGTGAGSLLLRLLRNAEAMAAGGVTPRLWDELEEVNSELVKLAAELKRISDPARRLAGNPPQPEELKLVSNRVTNISHLLKRPRARLGINKYMSLLVEKQSALARELRERLGVGDGMAHLLGVRRLLCGDQGPDLDPLASFSSMHSFMQKNMTQRFTFVPDPDVSPLCNEYFRSIEVNLTTRIMWRWIKPFVRGQILYAPATKATRRVMGRVDDFFAAFRRLQMLVHEWSTEVLPRAQRCLDTLTETLKLFEREDLRATLEAIPEGPQLQTALQWLSVLPKSYSVAQKLLTGLSDVLHCFLTNKTVAMASEAEALERGLSLVRSSRLWAVIIFEGEEVRAPFATYKIRVDRGLIDNTHFLKSLLHSPGPRMHPFLEMKYFTSGFLYLQDLVERSLIEEFLASEEEVGAAAAIPRHALPGFIMQQFPYPCHIKDRFSFAVTRTFPLLMTLSWVYACASLVKAVVMEKEERLVEAQRVAGVGDGAIWTAWYLDGFLTGGLSAILLSALLVLGGVLENTTPSLVVVFLLCYCAASAAFACLMSVFFSRASVAAGVSGMVFVLSYLPYATLDLWGSGASSDIKYLLGLLSNVAFGFGCLYLSSFEQLGVGATWDRASRSPYVDDGYSMVASMVALVIDAFLYMILAWYISNVWPGRYGVRKPLLFPLTRTYWCGVSERELAATAEDEESPDEAEIMAAPDPNDIDEFSAGPWRWGVPVLEPASPELIPGIRIRKLTKVFPGGRLAVDRLSLTFYEGHITAFLGHNGAGKTTVISMLTGLLPPTSGTAYIRGLDIRRHMPIIRRSLGFCPQHNVLYDKMTASEHLWLAARLRGRPSQKLRAEVPAILSDLGMLRQASTQACRLSGGARRKLCLAAAFVGNCRTVILDEPTAGVDPASRRAIWRLLERARRQGRTLVLCTHHLDEAERLGDRVAVLARGRLLCAGSPMYLRRRLGMGYRLSLDVMPASAPPDAPVPLEPNADDDANPDKEGAPLEKGISTTTTKSGSRRTRSVTQAQIDWLTSLVRARAPGARLVQRRGCELLMALPYRRGTADGPGGSCMPGGGGCDLPGLFADLLEAQHAGALRAFGVRDSSLEEIFLQLPRGLRCGERSEVESRSPEQGADVHECFNRPWWPFRFAGAIQRCWQRDAMRGAPSSSASSTAEAKAGVSEKSTTKEFASPETTMKHLREQRPQVEEGGFGERAQGCHLRLRQLRALLLKRLHHTRRSPKVLFCELVMPPLFITTTLALTQLLPRPDAPPPLTLQPWLYGPPRQTFFEEVSLTDRRMLALSTRTLNSTSNADGGKNTSRDGNGSAPMAEFSRMLGYAQALLGTPGMGTRCTLGTDGTRRDPKCVAVEVRSLAASPKQIPQAPLPPCSCSTGAQECPPGATGPSPPTATVCTGDVLMNLTGRDVSEWLVRSTSLHEDRIYGGFSFGARSSLDQVEREIGDSLQELMVMARNRSSLESTTTPPTTNATVTPPNMIFNTLLNSNSTYESKFIKVWFNNKGWATSPAYLNAINNVVLRTLVAEARMKAEIASTVAMAGVGNVSSASTQSSEKGKDSILGKGSMLHGGWPPLEAFGITAVNHPLNNTMAHMHDHDHFILMSNINVVQALAVLLAMSFVPASFLVLLVEERASRAKHLQMLCGVSPVIYWLAELFWGLVCYTVATFLCVLVFLGFNETAYISPGYLEIFISLLLFYGWATVPMMYTASFLFREPSTAFVLMACLNLAIGMLTSVAIVLLQLFGAERLMYLQENLRSVFLIFPQFCLTQGLIDLVMTYYTTRAQIELSGQSNISEATAKIKPNIWFMVIQGIFFFLLTLFIEMWPWNFSLRICWHCWPLRPFQKRSGEGQWDPGEQADTDVAAERARVKAMPSEQQRAHALLLKDLTKEYRGGPLAVDALCLGVRTGECFGLLGLNGAGKTTTFKMLTGESRPTSGDALVGGASVRTASAQALRRCGYCPQVDALHAQLSVLEHLGLYARLRGFDKRSVDKVVREMLLRLQLWRCRHQRAGTLSGGTRRKLSAALALLGEPPVLLLDEPTAGMDADARAALRSCVLAAAAHGAGALLTSHALAESEALSTRLSVMAAGRLRCLGSAQHLKTRFGRGYLVEVRAPAGATDGKRLWALAEQLPGADGGGRGGVGGGAGGVGAVSHARFELPTAGASELAAIFSTLEQARADDIIEDYSVTQATLEEVFLRFAFEAVAEEAGSFACNDDDDNPDT